MCEYGATGDGVTDDTEAINHAIADGARCGAQADSCTTAPALVYFPSGTYRISKPIVSFYNTHILGDAVERPVLAPVAHFEGIAVIDENPYEPGGRNWYIPQNNFFRSVANLVIDLRAMPPSAGTGIHHQVSQATGLTNVHFEMVRGAHSQQQGIFMENASGGFMSDLSFTGGRYGAWVGNQQFTVRNLRFAHCQTAICQFWNWAWTYMDVQIEDCGVGIEMHPMLPDQQGVGSLYLADWCVQRTSVAVQLESESSGRLVLDRMHASDVPAIVQVRGQTPLLASPQVSCTIPLWIKAPVVQPVEGLERRRDTYLGIPPDIPERPACMVDAQGRWFGQEKPQCTLLAHTDPLARRHDMINVCEHGAVGDGATDDRAALQAVLDNYVGAIILGT